MQIEDLIITLKRLYEGRDSEQGLPLDDNIEFRDPMVIVRGQNRVLRMFRRLNALFPATRIVECTPMDHQHRQFALCVHYGRSPQSTPKVFRTTLDIQVSDGRLTSMVEHWTQPMNLRGDSERAISTWVRSGLGRLLS